MCDKAVGDKVECEREMCVKKLCPCLTKLCAIKLQVRERCERLCVTKLCVCDKVVFERNGLACSVDVTKCHACHAKRRSMSPSATPATQNAHARSSSSRRLCVRRLPTRAAAPPRGSVYCASTLSLTCVMSWCESHVWCEMCVMSVVRAKCCAMGWCESHVWCELVCLLSAV